MPDNFKWTDELIKEYISRKLGLPAEHPYHLQQLEDFKKSKEPDVPKEWEILEIDCYDTERRYLINGLYRLYEKGVGFKLDYLLKRPDAKIHSVKRLADGEVFSIGDKIVISSTVRGPIEEFTLNDGVLKVNGKGYSMLLESIKPVPKEYEILSIIVGGVVSEYTGSDTQDKLLDFGYPINSIKRLSDGEIFIIGDTLDEMEIGENVITGFFANFKGNSLWVSTNNERGYGCSLGVAKKKKVPVFTSADGVDIFEDGLFYHVCDSFEIIEFSVSTDWINYKGHRSRDFSTREKAEEYRVCNKPIAVTYNELYCAIENRPLANIKDFFKSKINP